MDERFEGIATANRPRDYAGLLWIFVASLLGFSLFCGTSAIALSDQTLPTPIVIEAGDIPDLAFSNLNTAAALTAEAFQNFVITATISPSPSHTLTETSTLTPSPTASRTPFIFTNTPTQVQGSGGGIITATSSPIPRPTNTAVVVAASTGTAPPPQDPTESPEPEPTATDPPIVVP